MTLNVYRASRASQLATEMRAKAKAFLAALDTGQRSRATFPFSGDERYRWHYTPIARNGLRLKEMTKLQRAAALGLMTTALSARAADEASAIIALETILDEWERIQHEDTPWIRDPELYYVSVFGNLDVGTPWGWRAGGHHIGVHATIVESSYVSVLPLFLGSNPAEIRHGDQKGTRILAAEEDLARALLDRLDTDQKRKAIVDRVAPDDILTKNYRVADPKTLRSDGIDLASLRDNQREKLVAVLRHYVDRAAKTLADNEWTKISNAGLDTIRFVWAGPEARGHGHYYAITGPSFVIEYDNTQNGANHIHSVMRNFDGDWGEDLLAAHYAHGHHE